MNYYFLVASLPALDLEEEPPFAVETFHAMCAEHLSERDMAVLDALLADRQNGDPPVLVREWRNRETRIRNALVAVRAARFKVAPAPHLRPQEGISLLVESRVNDLQSRPTPLARELDLDRLRWQEAEEFAGFDPFSIRAVMAYAVKLRLAGRWAAMDADAGTAQLDQLVNREPGAAPEAREQSA